MSTLQVLNFSYEQCLQETLELRDLLNSKTSLKERDDILPFFEKRMHLSAFIGSDANLISYNRIAHEMELNGSFVCDLVVGDWDRRRYAFIEFEDATPKSIFVKKKHKQTPEWSPRFEHGFSQLVDWFFLIDEIRSTTDFQTTFGTEPIDYVGLLILGRTQHLETRELARLMCEHVEAGGEIDQVPERRPEWNDHDFHYDLRFPIAGRLRYLETLLLDKDPEDPTIYVVSIHDA
jgi:hypothetical protein